MAIREKKQYRPKKGAQMDRQTIDGTCRCCRKQAKNLWGCEDVCGDVIWVCDVCYKDMIDVRHGGE